MSARLPSVLRLNISSNHFDNFAAKTLQDDDEISQKIFSTKANCLLVRESFYGPSVGFSRLCLLFIFPANDSRTISSSIRPPPERPTTKRLFVDSSSLFPNCTHRSKSLDNKWLVSGRASCVHVHSHTFFPTHIINLIWVNSLNHVRPQNGHKSSNTNTRGLQQSLRGSSNAVYTTTSSPFDLQCNH